jgi:ribosome maturation factor RimP
MLSREAIIQRVNEIAKPILDSMGIELVEVVYAGGGRGGLLRVFIDKPEGVSLNDCEKVSHFLGHALDVEDPISVSYTLEVSSPGLDRPLKRKEDYRRSIGKLVRVKTLQPIGGEYRFIGRLAGAGESQIEVVLPDGRAVTIPFEGISSARLEVEF